MPICSSCASDIACAKQLQRTKQGLALKIRQCLWSYNPHFESLFGSDLGLLFVQARCGNICRNPEAAQRPAKTLGRKDPQSPQDSAFPSRPGTRAATCRTVTGRNQQPQRHDCYKNRSRFCSSNWLSSNNNSKM